MRKFLIVVILAVMVSGVVSAAGKRPGDTNHPARYVPSSFDAAIVQVVNNVDGEIWLIVAYRGGAGLWFQAVPLLPPDTVYQLRSIYDGPDPTTGYTGDDDADAEDARDEAEGFGLETNDGGVSVSPTGSGTHGEDDD